MSIEIKVPAMGESVTEATVARWFKKEGESVKRDEPLLELETDKVTVEVPAPADGAIESISRPGRRHGAGGRAAGRHRRRQGRQAAAACRRTQGGSAESRSAQARAAPRPAAPKSDAPAMPSAQPHRRRNRHLHCRRSPAPAGTAASPRATCWARWNPAPPSPAAPRPAPSGPRHNADARRKGGDDAAAQDHRAAPEGIPEHRRPAHHLQRGGHDPRSWRCAASTRTVSRRSTACKLGFMGFFAKAVRRGAEGNCPTSMPRSKATTSSTRITTISASRFRPSAAWWCRWCATPTSCRWPDIEKAVAGFRHPRPRQQAEAGRAAGRHLLHHQWRGVRLADVHADPQFAPVRHSGHAQDPAPPDGDRRQGRDPSDDVSGAVL